MKNLTIISGSFEAKNILNIPFPSTLTRKMNREAKELTKEKYKGRRDLCQLPSRAQPSRVAS